MHYSKTQSRLCHLISFCIALTMFQACDVDDLVGLNFNAVEEYGSFFGNPHHQTVIIHSQRGAPNIKLLDADLIDLIAPVNTNTIIVANVSQSQILESRALYQDDLTESDAEAINNQSVDDLARVIRHFKDQDKTVFVLGTGFGGYLTQELLARYGSDIADKYLIIGSRLYIEQELVIPWMEGITAFIDYDAAPNGVMSLVETIQVQSNLNRLFGAIAQDNYQEKLANLNLSKVTYIMSDKDEVVGTLTKEEQNFLTQKNAKLLFAIGNHEEGKHESIVQGVQEGFGIE